jgi:hypothetical protein
MSHSKYSSGFFRALLVEDQTNQFRDLAAALIEDQDLKTDLENVLLKTPSSTEACDAFVYEGRIK